MKTKLLSPVILITTLLVGFISCTDNALDVKPCPQNLDLTGSNVDPSFSLGRVLFYDNHLSVNNAISCASCHKQALAFSDHVNFSSGFENHLTKRNALPIQNLNFHFRMIPIDSFEGTSSGAGLFWDGREQFLSNMVLVPMVNHVEMGMSDGNAIANKVKTLSYYKSLFVDAFGNPEVTPGKISQALCAFVGSINSFNSKFDQSQNGSATLSPIELQGKNLFFNKYNCNTCHQIQFSNIYGGGGGGTAPGFVNIGLEANYSDQGLGGITNNASDNGKFKIPDLHNVALTAPYMHDGRFATLAEVLNHYSHGIVDHPNLDPLLKNADGSARQMNISDQEKGALIAFLNTLTDYSMVTAKEFSSPFKAQ